MEQQKSYNHQKDEIDLLELLQTVWNGRITILKFIAIFGLIGLFIAIFSAKEYTASTTVVPQISGSKAGGNLGGLAAMAGINLGGSIKGIPPSLYPKIVQSVPFQKELLRVPLQFSNLDKEVTYQEYYENHQKFNVLKVLKEYTIGLPSKILTIFKSRNSNPIQGEEIQDSICRISIEEKQLFNQLQQQLTINHNSKEGFMQISFSMPEALPAAQMTKRSQELLQKAITDFKIQKAQEEFQFIAQRYKEVKADFTKKQAILASVRDRNQGLITSRSQSRLERLQSEYNLAYGIYSELAKELETQKIKLKGDTPVFTVIDPVSVPVQKSKPRRVMILIIWLFLGGVLGTGFVLGNEWIKNLKVL